MVLNRDIPEGLDKNLQPNGPASIACPELNESKSFRAVFEKHMPPSKKPIKYESVAVLLLSFDSSDRQFAEYDVRDEVCFMSRVFAATKLTS
jgi:hypothetical protein